MAGTLFCLMLLLLAGCASSRVPQAISKASEKPVLVSQVQQAPDRFLDRRMRWGGTILAVRNRKRANEIEILSRPLESGGQPRGKEPGQGRFLLALLTGFADPAGYSEKRLLAVTGRLKRVEARPIGEYPYPYPVVAIEQSYLWPKPSPPVPPYHFHPDPWYHPWYYPGTLDTLGTGRMKCSTAASMRYPGIFIICPFLLAVGCASNPPCLTSIGTSFITPSVASATGKYVGKPAQWGGTLLDTHHFKDRTEFEMIAYPLDGCGRPHVGFGPTGRFIIVHPRFLDTTDYQIGQAVSATGHIIGIRKGWLWNVGSRFPLLESYKVHPWLNQTAHGYHSHHSHGDYLYPWINLGIGGRRNGVFWRVGVTL